LNEWAIPNKWELKKKSDELKTRAPKRKTRVR